MQTYTTLRCRLPPVRMAVTKETTYNKGWRGCREKGHSSTLGELQASAATLEINMKHSQDATNISPISYSIT